MHVKTQSLANTQTLIQQRVWASMHGIVEEKNFVLCVVGNSARTARFQYYSFCKDLLHCTLCSFLQTKNRTSFLTIIGLRAWGSGRLHRCKQT